MKKINLIAAVALSALFLFAGCGEGPDPNGEDPGHNGEDPPVPEQVTLEIADVIAWIDCAPSEFVPVWSDSAQAEPLEYEYDETLVELSPEAHTVKALAEGLCEVRAYSENFSVEFTVDCREIGMDIEEKWRTDVTGWHPDWPTRLENFKALWKMSGTPDTTVFAGDSFFDASGFWTNFYDTYNGKDALCFGIGSTHSYNWEYLADHLLADMTPRNLVMHIGTNNVYDQGDTADMATEALQRMFTVLHDRLPDTQIWWFTITQRSYDEMKQYDVSLVNKAMMAWCKDRSWITCLDTSPLFTADMLKDSIHPKLEEYRVFVDALNAAGIEIADSTR